VLGSWVAWVHAPLAIAMAMHGMAMLRRF